jgi:FtsP/CotA-like multicopper oxidase with cupredoxin domain
MKLVGADNGKYEREEWINSVVLGPSELIVVEIWFDKAGEYQMINKTPKKTHVLGTVAVSASPVTKSYFLVTRVNQDIINSLAVLRSIFTKPADKTLKIALKMMEHGTEANTMHRMPNDMMMEEEENMHSEGDNSEKIEWEDTLGMMNAMSNTKMVQWKLVDEATGKENMNIYWLFQKGDKVKIKIINDPSSFHPMQHPIHIHGQRFLVTSINGISNQNLVWKDTVLVQTGDTVELLVDMTNPGNWLIHCHIPEHMEAGMMLKFKII